MKGRRSTPRSRTCGSARWRCRASSSLSWATVCCGRPAIWRVILRIVAVASVGNLLLEIVAVYVLDMGIAGSAWSTVVVQVVAAVAYVRALRPVIAASPTWTIVPAGDRRHAAGRRTAAPPGRRTAGHVHCRYVAARVDAATLGAHQIVVTTFFLVALVLDALAIPAQSLVAEAMGANDIASPASSAAACWHCHCGSGVGLALLLAALSPLLPRVFTSDEAVIERATAGLLVLAVTLVPGAVAFALDGVLIGAAEFRFQSILMIVALAVFLLRSCSSGDHPTSASSGSGPRWASGWWCGRGFQWRWRHLGVLRWSSTVSP